MKSTCSFLFVLAFSILTATANAQVTSITLNSDPGDFIVGGQSLFFTPADGTFNATTNYDSVNTELHCRTVHFWFIVIISTLNEPLSLGTFTGATRFPFQ